MHDLLVLSEHYLLFSFSDFPKTDMILPHGKFCIIYQLSRGNQEMALSQQIGHNVLNEFLISQGFLGDPRNQLNNLICLRSLGPGEPLLVNRCLSE